MKYFALLFCVLVSLKVVGQLDSIHLAEVIVSENRISLPFSDHSHVINIIREQEIEQISAQSISEVLQWISGVDIRRRGPHGVQADVGIRGSTFDQVLILIDGIKMIDPQTGHHLMNIPVPLNQVARIEVLKGPAARRYGQNAFAGAINIVTKESVNRVAGVSLQGGQNATGRVAIDFNLPQEFSSHSFAFSKSFSEGYRYNTDYDLSHLYYKGVYKINDRDVRLTAGHVDRAFGANGFYASPDFMDQYEDIQTTVVNLDYRTEWKDWLIIPRLFYRRNQDEYVFVRSNPSIYRNLHISHVAGLEANATTQSTLGITGLGVEWRSETLRSNNLGSRHRSVLTLFAEHRFQWLQGQLDVTPGISFNNYSDFGSQLFPGIEAGWHISSKVKAFGSVGYTYRVPTFTDLYYEDQANQGNPSLLPESAVTYEIGSRYLWPKGHLQGSIFSRVGQDLIDWTKANEDDPWRPDNFGQVVMKGLELEGNLRLPEAQWIKFAYTYLHGEITTDENTFSRYALENLKHQVSLGIHYQITRNLFHTVQWMYFDRAHLDNYSLVNTKLIYQKPSWSLFLTVDNVLDVRYRETNLVEMPGRWTMLGVDFKIDY